MIKEVREIYRCEHCKKVYLREHACKDHEIKCNKNPQNNRPCLNGCKFLEKRGAQEYFDTYNGGEYRPVQLFYCTKFENFMYPPQVEHKGNAFDLDTDKNVPMPTECKEFKIETYGLE